MVPDDAKNLWGYTKGYAPLYIALGGAGALLLALVSFFTLISVLIFRFCGRVYAECFVLQINELFIRDTVRNAPKQGIRYKVQ